MINPLLLAPRWARLTWWTGPILDKELRVASRRRRNYALRGAYLLLLTVLLGVMYHNITRRSWGGQAMMMAEAGRAIAMFIAWFQLIVLSLVSIVLLSGSVSEEIQHRTLGVLMTTPITGLQIVLGKLFSKLLQVFMLLALSVPLLAVVRVMGGVPWEYVIASICITFTSVLLAGAVALDASIASRRTYSVILGTIIKFALYYALPWIVFVTLMLIVGGWRGPEDVSWLFAAVVYIQPFAMQGVLTAVLEDGTGMAPGHLPIWWVHCLIMLGLAALVIARSAAKVRRIALRQACGETFEKRRRRKTLPPAATQYAPSRTVGGAAPTCPPPPPGATEAAVSSDSLTATGTLPPSLPVVRTGPRAGAWGDRRANIRPVTGHPVVWKELRGAWFAVGRGMMITIALAGAALVLTYLASWSDDGLRWGGTHGIYAAVFVSIGILVTSILSATRVSSEKESGSWPILLCTPLSNSEILMGKFIGTVRQALPVWIVLGIHMLIFTITGHLHPVVWLHNIVLVVWLTFFVTCSGLMFSTLLRRTTTAVVMNLGLCVTLWLILPVFMEFLDAGSSVRVAATSHPIVQAFVVNYGAARTSSRYGWPVGEGRDAVDSLLVQLLTAIPYTVTGCVLYGVAVRNVRRRIF